MKTKKPPVYKPVEFCVTVLASLTIVEFRNIEVIIDQRLGGHKSWADKFIFTPTSVKTKNLLARYLQSIDVTHTVEVTNKFDGKRGMGRVV